MPSAQLICPKCQTVLRPAKPLAPGAVVQCPKCATRFRAGGPTVPAETSAPAVSADDFASFSRPDEEPTNAPRRRGGCGPILLVGCLLVLAPLLGAGGVLAYCTVVYWQPSIRSMIQGGPIVPQDKGADKP